MGIFVCYASITKDQEVGGPDVIEICCFTVLEARSLRYGCVSMAMLSDGSRREILPGISSFWWLAAILAFLSP